VKPVNRSTCKKKLGFHNTQLAAKKDVERALGILQAQFTIVRGPTRFWDQEILWYIMNVCVIMHITWSSRMSVDKTMTTRSMSWWVTLCKYVGEKRGWPALLPRTIRFDKPMCIMSFKMISSRSGGHGMANKITSCMFVILFYVVFFILLIDCFTICCIIDELYFLLMLNYLFML
jgi:hypothetical protein